MNIGDRHFFKDPATNSFYSGTTFDDIYNLYLFDAELRDVFLKYILIFEKHVKSSISYHFSNTYGNGIAFYQDINNFDYGNHLSDVQYLFRKMNGKITEKVVKHPDRAEADRFFNYPFAAVEEALSNAVYHRAYDEREPIELRELLPA